MTADTTLGRVLDLLDREIACAHQAGDDRVVRVLTRLRDKVAEAGA